MLDDVAPLGYPMFVKPANLGSSVGISKVKSQVDLVPAIELALAFDVGDRGDARQRACEHGRMASVRPAVVFTKRCPDRAGRDKTPAAGLAEGLGEAAA